MAEIIQGIVFAAVFLAGYWWGRSQGYSEGKKQARATARPVVLNCGGGFQIVATADAAQTIIQQFGFHVISKAAPDERRRRH